MDEHGFKYIYGPVSSWRLGRSLGIDPISRKNKICGFDCVYCQLGREVPFQGQRQVFVPAESIIEELKQVPEGGIDYITISGSGEPTLAKNLGRIIKKIKLLRREPVAVITNSALISDPGVRRELALADFVMAKLDAGAPDVLARVNNPQPQVSFSRIVKGLKQFRRAYHGKLALQVMFVSDNIDSADDIAKIAKEIDPDEIQINTPLRESSCPPLSKAQVSKLKNKFSSFNTVGVYDGPRKIDSPISKKATRKRRGVARER